MAIVQRGLTLYEFLRLPEEKPALEFEDGVVTQKVSPKNRHSRLQGRLLTVINAFAEPRELAVAFPELRVTWAGVSRVPDVAVIRWDRLPLDDADELTEEFFGPPDIAVEIRSPEQSLRYLIDRCTWYVEHEVELALLVDPLDRSVRAFSPGQPPRRLAGADLIDFAPVVPGLTLSVDALFGALRFARRR